MRAHLLRLVDGTGHRSSDMHVYTDAAAVPEAEERLSINVNPAVAPTTVDDSANRSLVISDRTRTVDAVLQLVISLSIVDTHQQFVTGPHSVLGPQNAPWSHRTRTVEISLAPSFATAAAEIRQCSTQDNTHHVLSALAVGWSASLSRQSVSYIAIVHHAR